MQTKTFTLLVTIADDGSAPAFNPTILAAAVQGALETGIGSFMLDSNQAAALLATGDPLLAGAKAGEHNLPPVASAVVHAFAGDRLEIKPGSVGATAAVGPGAARRLHAALRQP